MAITLNDQKNQGVQPVASKPKGSGFTNLQRVMQANQSNKLGGAVGGGIQTAAQQAKEQLGQSVQQFGQKAQESRLGTEEQKQQVQNILGAGETAAKARAEAQDKTQAPSVLGSLYQPSEEDISQFQRYRSGQYEGPKGLIDSDRLAEKAIDVESLGRGIGSSAGRQGLLQRFVGQGQYTTGQQSLDNLLLGAGGQQPLAQARRQALGTLSQFGTQSAAAGAQAQQFGAEAQKFGQDVTQRAQTVEEAAQQEAEQRAKMATEYETGLSEQARMMAQKLGESGELTPEAAAALGLTAGQQTYGLNLGNYIGYKGRGALPVEAPEVLSQDEYSKFVNLNRLLGQQAPAGFEEGKVGKYEKGALTYDKAGVESALKPRQERVQQLEQGIAEAENLNKLATGQLSPDQTQRAISALQANPQILRNQGYNAYQAQELVKSGEFSPQLLGQVIWTLDYAGRGGNAPVIRQDWAAQNLANAQAALQGQLQQWQAGQTIKIQPGKTQLPILNWLQPQDNTVKIQPYEGS